VQFEESISIDILQELKDAFVLADIDGNGRLDFDEFKQVFKMELNISEAKVCFADTLNSQVDYMPIALGDFTERIFVKQMENMVAV